VSCRGAARRSGWCCGLPGRQSIVSCRGAARRRGRCCGLPGRQSLAGGKIEGKMSTLNEKINFCAPQILKFEVN